MIRRLLKRNKCLHLWRKTYVGITIDDRYTCVKCGKVHKVSRVDKGSWKVRREIRGDEFE